jgi:two-component system NtrC family sensor kinase
MKGRIDALLSRLARPQGAADDAERLLVWLRLAIGLAAVLPMLLVAVVAWHSFGEAAREAQRTLEAMARAAEEHAVRVMDRNDVVMQQMVRVLKDDDDARIRAREPQLHELARAILLRFSDIRSLSVWSGEGKPLVSTLFFPVPHGVSRVDWDYFRWGHRSGDAGSLTRGLLVDEATGERLFRMTRLRLPARGRAGGEIELLFSPSEFNEPYRRLTEGDGAGSVAMVNAEGVIVANWPPTSPVGTRLHTGSRLLQRIAAGEPRGVLTQDVFVPGDRRFAAFRKVGDHPLFIATVQDAAAVLAGWQRQVLVLGIIALPVTIALVLASWLALRRTVREIEATQRLSEESRQRLLAEESLRHAQRLDALGQLAGGLAHDFNNLLAIVSSSADLLAKVLPGAAARPELASIRRAAQRGTKLTRRLLAFFRRQALHPERVAVGPALDDMLDVLRTTAGTGIALNIDVHVDTPPIEVDAAELEIALINLVANARDAMRGAGRIDIRARRGRPGEGPDGGAARYALISVSDSGEGMSAETLNRAFEPFFTTKPAGSGTGLGLSQVFGFCEQSAGSVKVTSELHVGTTVCMFLPVSAGELPAEAPAGALAPLSARVLLVQRDGDDSSPLAVILRKYGCVVASADSVREAERLALVEKGSFDAVLICAPAGEPEGAAFVSRLHRREPGLPVIMVGSSSGVAPAELIGILSKAISAHRPAPRVH